MNSYTQILWVAVGALKNLTLIMSALSEKRKFSNVYNKNPEFENINLSDLKIIKTIGAGGYGRVELVQINSDRTKSFALKRLKKAHIVGARKRNHVLSEKKILADANCDFIVKLHKTFKTEKYLYMLMDVCLGGELWTVLRDMGRLSEPDTRFYIGCVIEAFDYLHAENIAYRDLKPENLLLDNEGYLKLVDFGFATKLEAGRKTYTLCGTPDYMAPELVLNLGHDISVDYWSLGVILFELLSGVTPFSGQDRNQTFDYILKGINSVKFPRSITRNAESFITGLCRQKPENRLGYLNGGMGAIKTHRWFEGFDWEELCNRTAIPPIIPIIRSATDTSNFDDYPPDTEDSPVEDTIEWDIDF